MEAWYHDAKIKTVTWEVTWMADHDMGEACPHTARIYVEVTTTFDSIDSTGYMLPVAVTWLVTFSIKKARDFRPVGMRCKLGF